jgi:hypothetical protein
MQWPRERTVIPVVLAITLATAVLQLAPMARALFGA